MATGLASPSSVFCLFGCPDTYQVASDQEEACAEWLDPQRAKVALAAFGDKHAKDAHRTMLEQLAKRARPSAHAARRCTPTCPKGPVNAEHRTYRS